MMAEDLLCWILVVNLANKEIKSTWTMNETHPSDVLSEVISDSYNKLTSVFYASVLLLIINFVITLSK